MIQNMRAQLASNVLLIKAVRIFTTRFPRSEVSDKIIDRLVQFFRTTPGSKNFTISANGVKMELDLYERIDSRIFFAPQLFNWQEMKRLQQRLDLGSVFVDVGANIGFYSLMAASQIGEAGRVIAFEPDPNTLPRLRRNIALNNFEERIQIVPVALSDQTGKVLLYQDISGRSGRNSLSAEMVKAKERAESIVEADTMDRVLERLGVSTFDALKIDVEGWEVNVLRGSVLTLNRGKNPLVIVEAKDGLLRKAGASLRELEDILAEAGLSRTDVFKENSCFE